MVAQKKINTDQKAQIVKKSALEDQRAQIENQVKIIEDVQQDLEAKHAQEKQSLVKDHEAEIEKIKAEASEASDKAAATKVREALHITCKFLHAAAFQRQRDDVDELESKAYEAVLFHLYQGNAAAVDTITNVIRGSSDKITEANNDELDFTFAQLRSSALATEDGEQNEAQNDAETVPGQLTSDPTIANAGLTELEDTATLVSATTENATVADPLAQVPEQASTTAEAANPVAESSWTGEASMTTENTQGDDWVQVPRDPAETETAAFAPAPQQSTTNWADEAGAAAEEQGIVQPISENDGFSEVRRERGGRARGGRGSGRGFEGRGRGRGRGEHRGHRGGGGRGRGGPRGAPAAAAS